MPGCISSWYIKALLGWFHEQENSAFLVNITHTEENIASVDYIYHKHPHETCLIFPVRPIHILTQKTLTWWPGKFSWPYHIALLVLGSAACLVFAWLYQPVVHSIRIHGRGLTYFVKQLVSECDQVTFNIPTRNTRIILNIKMKGKRCSYIIVVTRSIRTFISLVFISKNAELIAWPQNEVTAISFC